MKDGVGKDLLDLPPPPWTAFRDAMDGIKAIIIHLERG
jgi:hypothetical protein